MTDKNTDTETTDTLEPQFIKDGRHNIPNPAYIRVSTKDTGTGYDDDTADIAEPTAAPAAGYDQQTGAFH